jgi:DNA repair photolyase
MEIKKTCRFLGCSEMQISDIKEIKCKSCMSKSKLSDYVINPYTGCQHGCKYCYAVFMKRFLSINEEWGEFVHAKINCPEFLEKELKESKPGHIWMSSITDCYMPLEAKYRLTRKILEIISNSPYKDKFTVEILTKSSLVRRDFDIIKKLNAEIGCSINTLNENVSKLIEPFASSPLERINILKDAKKQGIRVYGFISPVLPGITNLDELFKELSFCDYVWVELLNTKASVLKRLMPVIEKNFPEKIKDFDFAINHPEEYYQKTKKHAEELSKKYNLRITDIIRHDKIDI